MTDPSGDAWRTTKQERRRALWGARQLALGADPARGGAADVTSEDAFRGNVNTHGQTVERYKLDVIEGGKKADD